MQPVVLHMTGGTGFAGPLHFTAPYVQFRLQIVADHLTARTSYFKDSFSLSSFPLGMLGIWQVFGQVVSTDIFQCDASERQLFGVVSASRVAMDTSLLHIAFAPS